MKLDYQRQKKYLKTKKKKKRIICFLVGLSNVIFFFCHSWLSVVSVRIKIKDMDKDRVKGMGKVGNFEKLGLSKRTWEG